MKFRLLLEKLSYDEALDLFDLKAGYTADDVNRRFKRLAMKFHPDRGGSVEQMQDLNDARDTLLKTAGRPSGSAAKKKNDFWNPDEDAWTKQRLEIEEIILEIAEKYFKNFDPEVFRNYFNFVFKTNFDFKVEYSKIFQDCHKYRGDSPRIHVQFESPDRAKIITFCIDIHYYRLFDMLRDGKSLSSDDMQVSYWSELFIDGKKQKVSQTIYSQSNKKAILMNPEIMFPMKKMEKIASGEKRKGVVLKKRDFESLFLLKYKGHVSNGSYWIPICGTADTERKVYIGIWRNTMMRVPFYCINANISFWFPGGKPANSEKVRKDFETAVKSARVYTEDLFETQTALNFFDDLLNKLTKADFDDFVRVLKPYLDRLPEVHEISRQEYNENTPKRPRSWI